MSSQELSFLQGSDVKASHEELEARKCRICCNLSPTLQYRGSSSHTGVQYTQLKYILEYASRGCSHCKILQTSLQAVDPQLVNTAVIDSGRHSTGDTKIFCDYLAEGYRNIRLEYVVPDYKLRVELYGISGTNNPEKFSLQKSLRTSQNSAESAETALEWVEDCVSRHSACGNGAMTPLPKRILDVGEHEEMAILRDSLDMMTHYACLSYCWGSSRTVITTKENISQHIQGISINLLPMTFRHAISFIRRIGLRYLWIDSLCIIQNDELDWREEAAKMSRYYGQAHITLAATMSQNADGGLFQLPAVANLNDARQDWTIEAMRHLSSSKTAPLFRRGWILQERLLSPRVLHFTDHEMCFECNTLRTCECKQDMPDDGWRMKQEYLTGTLRSQLHEPTPDMEYIWRRLVEEYCKLNLTKPRDKLPALSGLADQIQSRRGSKYIAGLWHDSLLQDLLWTVHVNHRANLLPKAGPWRAPSWSWASVSDPVRYNRANSFLHETFCTVVGINCTWDGPSTTGELISGSVVLRGPTLEGIVQNRFQISEGAKLKKPFPGTFDADYRLCQESFPVLVMRIARNDEGFGKSYSLVLKQMEESIEYERIGLLQSSDTLSSVWSRTDWTKAEVRTITVL